MNFEKIKRVLRIHFFMLHEVNNQIKRTFAY